VTRAPAHAGRLRLNERLAFVMVFTVMATFVVGLSVLAARTDARTGAGRPLADGLHTKTAQQGVAGQAESGKPEAGTVSARPSQVLNARLTAALRAALGARAARLSVGVIDTGTGAEALYGAARQYHAGGIAGVDILAALLYEQRQAGTQISKKDAGLAAEMIKNDSGIGSTRLWHAIGRGAGLAAANRALGLRHTVPGARAEWGLTRTTVTDQLRLLTDLAEARSPLDSAGRDYELGLMSSVAPTWRWGVPAAASPGASYAVTNGWLANPHRFVVNSVGVIDRAGHELLVVILSRNWRTEAAGISEVQAAADAAVGAMLTSA
jgi:hypothetical protein